MENPNEGSSWPVQGQSQRQMPNHTIRNESSASPMVNPPANDFLLRMESMLRRGPLPPSPSPIPVNASSSEVGTAKAITPVFKAPRTNVIDKKEGEFTDDGSASMDTGDSDDEGGPLPDKELELQKTKGKTPVGDVPKETTELTWKQIKADRTLAFVLDGTGPILQTIQAQDIEPIDTKVTWDESPELICCYNWVDSADTNSILVPGEPPRWTQPQLPYTVELDSGYYSTDYNQSRNPRYPFTPMFHALGAMNKDYQFTDVDILADRNSLRLLLEFVQGKGSALFRMDAYLVGKTIMLVKRLEKDWNKGTGYGHNFEKHFTRAGEGMKDASSHYRVIRYNMGPLNVAVRFEADAYYEEPGSGDTQPVEVEVVNGGPTKRPRYSFKANIMTLQKGNTIPCGKIAELKTQVIKYEADGRLKGTTISPHLDQLWFGRTSHILTGKYQSDTGIFETVKYTEASASIANWEEKTQESLRGLVALLMHLRERLRAEKGPIRAVALVREDKAGPLTVRVLESKNQLQHWCFSAHWREIAKGRGRHRQQEGFGRRGGGGFGH